MGTEIEALQALETALSGLPDPAARERVLTWAWGRFVPATEPLRQPPIVQEQAAPAARAKTAARRTSSGSAKPGKARPKPHLAVVKDLNLKPPGKKSLNDFVAQKAPRSHQEKITVSVHYLREVAAVAAVTIDHIYTCYKHMQWRVPADLSNKLSVTANEGWLDASNRQAIRLTTPGENYVEHDLPKTKAK